MVPRGNEHSERIEKAEIEDRADGDERQGPPVWARPGDPRLKDDEQAWYLRPAVLGTLLIVCCVILNLIFW